MQQCSGQKERLNSLGIDFLHQCRRWNETGTETFVELSCLTRSSIEYATTFFNIRRALTSCIYRWMWSRRIKHSTEEARIGSAAARRRLVDTRTTRLRLSLISLVQYFTHQHTFVRISCTMVEGDGGRKGRNFIYTFVATLMVLSGTDGGVEEGGLLSRMDTHELQ